MEEAFLLALLTRAVAMVTWVLAVTHVFILMRLLVRLVVGDRVSAWMSSASELPEVSGNSEGLGFRNSSESLSVMWSGRYVYSSIASMVPRRVSVGDVLYSKVGLGISTGKC